MYITVAYLCVLQILPFNLSNVEYTAHKKSGSLKGISTPAKGTSTSKETSAQGSRLSLSKGTSAPKSYMLKSGKSYMPKSYMPKRTKSYYPKGTKGLKGTKVPKSAEAPISTYSSTAVPVVNVTLTLICIGNTFKSSFSAPV